MKNVIKKVATTFDATQALAKELVEAVFAEITAELKANGSIRIHNFGTISTVAKPARKGRNPKTGETIDVAAKTIVKFAAAKVLKEKVQ